MNKIKIIKNPHGDTRHAPKDTTFAEFHQANFDHILDVQAVMFALAKRLEKQGEDHDRTKLEYEERFWRDFQAALLNGEDFTKSWWYLMHVHEEKHHPLSNCHHDINLLDVIEMIVDCVCAAKTRAGSLGQLKLDEDILRLAFRNAVMLVDDMTEVVE